jgi:hypothetical protein
MAVIHKKKVTVCLEENHNTHMIPCVCVWGGGEEGHRCRGICIAIVWSRNVC